MKFKEYISEKIILPDIETFFSTNIKEMKINHPSIIFDNSIPQIGHYNPRTKIIKINLSKIHNKQDFIKVLFHESIHMIQDEKTLIGMSSILIKEKIKKRDIKDKLFFLGEFEIMAYASTVALKLIFEGKELDYLRKLMIKDMSIISELLDNNKFKKYVALYYTELNNKKIYNLYNLSETYSIKIL